MSEKSDFDKFRPTITEVMVAQVASQFGAGGEVLSIDGKRTGLDAFIIQLASDSELFGPYLLNATTAKELCARLIAEGFGPHD